MKNILPDWLYKQILNNYNLSGIQELRIRKNQPIQICYKGSYVELKGNSGLYLKPIIATTELIDYIISNVTKKSLYAFEEQIKNGYIVTENGIRIGICGTVVNSNDKITFIKNITSLNIRIAHSVRGCSGEIINYIYSNGLVKNTLIVSSPGAGKTTLLRDIINKLSEEFDVKNIMVVDEKFEIEEEHQLYNLGKNVDVMQGSNKKFAFYSGIKVMNPNVIATDELITEEDIEGVKFAIRSGVKVLATVHANSLEEIKSKLYFDKIINDKYFERIIVLSKRNGVGTIEGVFDENTFALFLPYLK